jgi:hypothetical protein
MRRFVSENLWPALSSLARNAVKRAAIAYVSSDQHVKFGDGDTLICDASPAAIGSGQTSATVLARAIDRGAEVYCVPGLHAKVMLLNGTAIIGSANASSSSTRLIEAAWITDEPKAAAMAQSFIRQLATPSARLNRAKVTRLLKIPVVRRGFPQARPPKSVVTKLRKLRTWIVGVRELARDPPEQTLADARADRLTDTLSNRRNAVEWLRWTGVSRFRKEAKRDDLIIQLWRPNGGKLPSLVYRPMSIHDRVEFESATYFFYELSPNARRTAIAWRKFLTLAKRAGITRPIAAGSQFEITEEQADALSAIWST